MTAYVALLRAVNVAGKKLTMADLRVLVADIGHTNIQTYIQSGNVVFTGRAAPTDRVAAGLQKAIARATGHETKVIVRTGPELAKITANNPFRRAKFDDKELHVTFLAAKPAAAATKALDPEQFAPDVFAITGREIYVRCPNGYGTTKINNQFFERKLACVATTRNWRTVTKLTEMATG